MKILRKLNPEPPMDTVNLHVLYCGGIHLTCWEYSDLSAPLWRLYWNRQPGAWIELRNSWMPLSPDFFYLIPPNTPFASRLDSPVDHHLIHFLTEHVYQAVVPQVIQFPAEAAFTNIHRHLWDYPVATVERKQILLPEALCLCYHALAHVPAKDLKPIPADPRIRRAIAYLRDHLDTAPSNELVAQVAHMHPTAFIRLFKQTIGTTPQAYSQMLRIEHACRLLHFSDASIENIANSAGFCDRYHFSRVFKKIQLVSPGAFRRRHQGCNGCSTGSNQTQFR